MIFRSGASLLFFLLSSSVFAQTFSITGVITDGMEPVPFANLVLKGLGNGTAADIEGKFTLENVTAGDYQLQVSVVGFMPLKKDVSIGGQNIDMGKMTLSPSVLGLDEVVITGTMKETFVSASPIKIDVITSAYLTKTSMPTNLVESVNLINGVNEVVGCGVCYTNSITINGLPGSYTAILVDGSPLYGNLASVYGLNSIPTSMIDRMEVIKGPNSTLYGSEAVAGVINIITKKPKDQPRLDINFMGTTHAEFFGDFAVSSRIGKVHNTSGASVAYGDVYEDDNSDGFGDFVSLDRVSVFSKWQIDRKEDKRATIMAKYYYEDRRNGVEEFMQNRAYRTLRGSDSIYGESIYTQRAEVFGTYDLPTNEHFWIDYSFSFHDQDSYYGADSYKANQYIGFANFIWNRKIKKHDLLVGLTGRYQWYDDNTVATADTINNFTKSQVVPGIFIQDDWEIVKYKFSLLGGARLDYYSAHGPIVSPRLSMKYKPGTWTTIRGNFGTGFKIVNLFTEDHAFVSGQREVVIEGTLKPEQSFNGSLNFNHILTLGSTQGSIDIDGFYTHFTNKIIPNYDNPGEIVYRNTEGHASTWGASATINHAFRFPLKTNLGFTYQNASETSLNATGETERNPILFSSDWSGVFSLIYTIRKIGVDIAYSGNITGPMQLPEIYDLTDEGIPSSTPRPDRSVPFFLDNIQISKTIKKINLRVFVGLENIMDYKQSVSPLSGTNDPNHAIGFSSYFDTSYAYAPIHGREIYAGIRWFLDKPKK
ncbi:MAG: outer membrane receptor for ferrienterochelin and colicins [Granulosicoccus sp.]|jgi:outer membrane receptor for ferrienterochelin and colicins